MTINKVTKCFPVDGNSLTEAFIQTHIDAQNLDGWYLVGVDNLVGWYRFFWAKQVA